MLRLLAISILCLMVGMAVASMHSTGGASGGHGSHSGGQHCYVCMYHEGTSSGAKDGPGDQYIHGGKMFSNWTMDCKGDDVSKMMVVHCPGPCHRMEVSQSMNFMGDTVNMKAYYRGCSTPMGGWTGCTTDLTDYIKGVEAYPGMKDVKAMGKICVCDKDKCNGAGWMKDKHPMVSGSSSFTLMGPVTSLALFVYKLL